MTDRPFDAATVPTDEELVFDDEAPEPAPPPRRAPRKGRPAPIDETGSAAVPEPVAEEPAGAPAPIPPRDAPPAGSEVPASGRASVLLAAIVGFAMLTSLVSLGATIAIARTLAAAHADRDRAAADAAALARVPAIVASLDAAAALLSRTPRPETGAPATAAEVRAAVDGLRLALAERRPDGISPIAGTLHQGFSGIDARLARIEAAVGDRRR